MIELSIKGDSAEELLSQIHTLSQRLFSTPPENVSNTHVEVAPAPAPAPAHVEAAAPTVTIEEIRAYCAAKTKEDAAFRPRVVQALAKFGASALSALKPSDLDAFYAEVQ